MRAAILRLVAAAAVPALAACVTIDGGAVEASWTVRTPDGRGSSCGCSLPRIVTMRFEVVRRLADGTRGPDACAGKSSCAFACDTDGSTGTTKFDIPPGDYEISVVPFAADGADLRPSVAANPQRRVVTDGQVTQLDNFLVEARCALECGGDDTTRSCKR